MRLDTGFRPSRNGFGFANAWHDAILGIVASRGRCGGMVFAALDHFIGETTLEPEAVARDLPPHRSPLERFIWRRQVDSVVIHAGANLARFAALTYLPATGPGGIASATRRELLPLFDCLRAGVPAPLGMVSGISLRHLVRNHQVLAYAAEFGDSAVTVEIYDPNHPMRDDVVLFVDLDGDATVIETVGAKRVAWRGFFVERYSPVTPPAGRVG